MWAIRVFCNKFVVNTNCTALITILYRRVRHVWRAQINWSQSLLPRPAFINVTDSCCAWLHLRSRCLSHTLRKHWASEERLVACQIGSEGGSRVLWSRYVSLGGALITVEAVLIYEDTALRISFRRFFALMLLFVFVLRLLEDLGRISHLIHSTISKCKLWNRHCFLLWERTLIGGRNALLIYFNFRLVEHATVLASHSLFRTYLNLAEKTVSKTRTSLIL